MIVSVPCLEIGDSLCTFGAIREMAEFEPVYVQMANRQIMQLLPEHPNIIPMFDPYHDKPCAYSPVLRTREKVRLCIHSAVSMYGKSGLHLTAAYARLAGLRWSGRVIEPPITSRIRKYPNPGNGILIAPWAGDSTRTWAPESWQEAIQAAIHEGFTVGVLGGKHDPRAWDGVSYHYGLSFDHVIDLLRRASGVVTVDSGVSHLARAAGVKNHAVICANVHPPEWVRYPDSYFFFGEVSNGRLVMQAMDTVLGVAA